jgi:hypothetical protein
MIKQFGKVFSLVLGVAALVFVSVTLAQAGAVPSAAATASVTSKPTQTSPAAIPPMSVRVESVPTVELKGPSGGWMKDLASSIVSLFSVVIALVAVIYGKLSNDKTIAAAQRSTEVTLWQKANETELQDIQAQLDEFYGPYLQMSEANHLLAQELRARQPEEHYRMLVKVFDRDWLRQLSAADRTIVREVCENAAKLEAFIRDHAKMVDPQILPYLSRASAHFRILHLAHKGELGSEFPPHLVHYVYPRQLDEVLKTEVRRLEKRCSLLRSKPYTAPGPIDPLKIPEDLTLDAWPSLPRANVETITIMRGAPEKEPTTEVPPNRDGAVLAKLRSRGLLDEDVSAEIAALWKYGVEALTDLALRSALVDFLENEAPLMFFVRPASLTGKHHPSWQRKKAGIVRNTIECCVVLDRQLQSYPEFTDAEFNVHPRDRDIVLVATILSDTFKYGTDELPAPDGVHRFDPEHGKKAAEQWRPIAARHGVSAEVIDHIFEATYWHLGRWTRGWEPTMRWSHYVDVTHRVDMFMSDNNLELVYNARSRIAV